jgi:cytochrome oxidase assembly protein ShyY1
VPLNARGRAALAIVVGVGVTVLAVSLGNWQTRRGDAKEALQAGWTAAEAAAPVDVRSGVQAGDVGQSLPQRVALRGRFVPEGTVYVDNRIIDGVVGFYVVTPLALAGGGHVLVNRGWVARDARDPLRRPSVALPPGEQALQGLAVARVPRLLELQPAPARALPGIWPNLDPADYRAAAGVDVAAFVVQQTSDNGDGLRRDWPRPDAGVEKHRGYALQWYGLAALAAGLTLWFGGRAVIGARA